MRVAQHFESACSGAGHEPILADVTLGPEGGSQAAIEGSDACVVVGGDGTLHHLLPLLVGRGVPLFHAAMGTENLFARECGHRPDPDQFLKLLALGKTREFEVGELSYVEAASASALAPGQRHPPLLFAVMASVGPDASIVNRLAQRRRGPIRRLSYLRPLLAETFNPHAPPTTVRVDGRVLVENARGIALVSTMKQYALRTDPSREADPTDGLLDVCFIPGATVPGLVCSLFACRLGKRHWTRAVHAQGRRIELEQGGAEGTTGQFFPQADGERIAPARGSLVAEVRPEALRVLVEPYK